MIDWLRRSPRDVPQVEVAGRVLPLAIRRTASARRMTMRLAPDGSEVRITLPRWGRTQEALEFARSRAEWLAQQLSALPGRPELRHGAVIAFLGADHAIDHDPGRPRRIVADGGVLRIGGPAEGIEGRLRRWLEAEARRLFAQDLAFYCARADRAEPPLALSRAQRRWGSCAASGTIRINWRLVMAPEPVRRSVVAHEVAHLSHFDHSARFHAHLADLFEGEVEAANRWLKAHGRGLYAPFG